MIDTVYYVMAMPLFAGLLAPWLGAKFFNERITYVQAIVGCYALVFGCVAFGASFAALAMALVY